MQKLSLSKNSLTHLEYKDFLANNSSPKKVLGSRYYLSQHPFIKNMADSMPCVTYIINYQTSRYHYVNKGFEDILGWTADEIMERGPQWVLNNVFHPDDLKAFSSLYFVRLLDFSKTLSTAELKKCRIALNYRMKRKDGSYIKLLQQSVILETNELNHPVLALEILTDITLQKHDNAIGFSISYYDKKKGFKILYSENIQQEETGLTLRENEITRNLIYGYNAKQIADKLSISYYTVRAHKRNIFKKTSSKNIAQLIKYALSNGIL